MFDIRNKKNLFYVLYSNSSSTCYSASVWPKNFELPDRNRSMGFIDLVPSHENKQTTIPFQRETSSNKVSDTNEIQMKINRYRREVTTTDMRRKNGYVPHGQFSKLHIKIFQCRLIPRRTIVTHDFLVDDLADIAISMFRSFPWSIRSDLGLGQWEVGGIRKQKGRNIKEALGRPGEDSISPIVGWSISILMDHRLHPNPFCFCFLSPFL